MAPRPQTCRPPGTARHVRLPPGGGHIGSARAVETSRREIWHTGIGRDCRPRQSVQTHAFVAVCGGVLQPMRREGDAVLLLLLLLLLNFWYEGPPSPTLPVPALLLLLPLVFSIFSIFCLLSLPLLGDSPPPHGCPGPFPGLFALPVHPRLPKLPQAPPLQQLHTPPQTDHGQSINLPFRSGDSRTAAPRRRRRRDRLHLPTRLRAHRAALHRRLGA